jgi:hypothetical protein
MSEWIPLRHSNWAMNSEFSFYFYTFGSWNYIKAPCSFRMAHTWSSLARRASRLATSFCALADAAAVGEWIHCSWWVHQIVQCSTCVVINLSKRSEVVLLPEEVETMIVSRRVVCCCFRSLALLLLLQVIEERINEMKIYLAILIFFTNLYVAVPWILYVENWRKRLYH